MNDGKKSGKFRPALAVLIVVMVIAGMATAVFSVNTDFKSYDKPETTTESALGNSVDKEPASRTEKKTSPAGTTTVTTTVTTTAETKPAAETHAQTETKPQTKSETKPQTVKGSPVQGDYACFNNSAFFGNSRFEGLRNLRLVPNVYAKVGLTVKTALTASDSDGASLIGKFKSGESFDNIFIMFGDNEIGLFRITRRLFRRSSRISPMLKFTLFRFFPFQKRRAIRTYIITAIRAL